MLTLDPNESSLLAQRIGQFGIMLKMFHKTLERHGLSPVNSLGISSYDALFPCIVSFHYVFLNGPYPASFSFIFGLFKQTNSSIFTTNICEKMSFKYPVLGFEPTTS